MAEPQKLQDLEEEPTEKEIPDGVQNPDQIKASEKKLIEEKKASFMKKTITNEIKLKTDPNTAPQGATTSKGVIPFANTQRPQPPGKFREEGGVIVAKVLAPQLGTDPLMRSRMQNDELKMGVLDYPILLSALHFIRRGEHDGVGYYLDFFTGLLRGTVGINGRGRKDVLQAMSNISGHSTAEIAKKPNILARNTWNKDWKQKAEDKGQTVNE